MNRDIILDIETFYNCFLIGFLDTKTEKVRMFEMSPWKNDWNEFRLFAKNCSNGFVRWTGYNNYYFDYPVIHYMLQTFKLGEYDGAKLAKAAYNKAQQLIQAGKDDKFTQIIWDNNQLVPQVDLFRIHHFDNVARSTSLKVLEFNMRSETVEDLPFDYKKPITVDQRDKLISYNIHDLKETLKFYHKSKEMIEFREKLSAKYERNFLNHNDTKIGKDYFIMELEKAGVKCYNFDEGSRAPNQTKREVIKIRDIIFPYIRFERPEFDAVMRWLKRQEIKETKGVFTEIDDMGDLAQYANMKTTKGRVKNLNCVIDGFQFDFGTGGIHGSIDSTIIEEDDEYAVLDYDVTSLYPSIAIVNEVYPKHLSKKFCQVYAQLKADRVSYKKGTPENAMLKLALNGVYGDSNNVYSSFYDPQYTMTITINGQLMLCMLAEMFMKVDSLKIIQINTDGITIKVKRTKIDEVEAQCKEWMKITRLDLERADYSKMFIRDVNNYVGKYVAKEGEKAKIKSKGAYEWASLYRPDHPEPASITWNKNHSAMVVPMAVQAHLIEGKDIAEFIRSHQDPFDFMLRVKAPKTSRLMWGETQIQNTTRYFISTDGHQMVKVMAPLAKNPDKDRPMKIHDGWKTTPMNTMGEVKNIDHRWYIEEALKLVHPLYDGLLAEMVG